MTQSLKPIWVYLCHKKVAISCSDLTMVTTILVLVQALRKGHRREVEAAASRTEGSHIDNYANPVYGVATICHQVR